MGRTLPRDHPNSVIGKRLFVDRHAYQDRDNPWTMRLRDLIQQHVRDLGGEDAISTGQRSICRRIAALTVELELIERRMALAGNGGTAGDVDLYIRGSGALRRLLEAIGLDRAARDITPAVNLQDRADRLVEYIKRSEEHDRNAR